MTKVLVYVPLAPNTPKIFGRSLTSIFGIEWDGHIDYLFDRRDHKPFTKDKMYQEIADKYNHARDIFLAGHYDYLLTVESDMIVPPLTLKRLIGCDADVAYGLYVSRHGRHQWLAYKKVYEDGTGTSVSVDDELVQEAWGSVIEVEGVGLGCTLIKREVMETLNFRLGDIGTANDWYFSLDVKEFGFSQVCDCGVVCGHMAEKPLKIYWPDPDAKHYYREEFIGKVTKSDTIEVKNIGLGCHKVYGVKDGE